jgi:antitoxin ParD1/3/4
MHSAEKISITMTSDMLRAIRESVESGEYASTSEAMRDAVRVWQRQRLEDAERLAAIRARIRRSIDDPRPSLTEAKADAHFKTLFAKTAKGRRNASA